MNTCTGLKVWMIKNKVSQNKMACDTGLHKNTIGKLVRSGEATKSVKMLVRLYLQIENDEFERLLELV